MALANIRISDKSEASLMKINLHILEVTGKRFTNKEALINASIAIASECMEFIDNESLTNLIKQQ
jgi:hypothetical protein